MTIGAAPARGRRGKFLCHRCDGDGWTIGSPMFNDRLDARACAICRGTGLQRFVIEPADEFFKTRRWLVRQRLYGRNDFNEWRQARERVYIVQATTAGSAKAMVGKRHVRPIDHARTALGASVIRPGDDLHRQPWRDSPVVRIDGAAEWQDCLPCRGIGLRFDPVRGTLPLDCEVCAGEGSVNPAAMEACWACRGEGSIPGRHDIHGMPDEHCPFCDGHRFVCRDYPRA